MPLVSGIPLDLAGPWTNTVPDPLASLFTLWDLSERDALLADPAPGVAWSNVGTVVRPGISKVTYLHALPKSASMRAFDGKRVYNTISAVAKSVTPTPRDLSFELPMVWLSGDTGWRLMTVDGNGNAVDVLGATGAGLGGIPRLYVDSGRVEKALHVAQLFTTSMYCASLGMTSPTALTYAQPGNPNGIALFTDGTGAAGSGGDRHYANPTNDQSARFKTVFPAYGAFEDNYGRSLTQIAQVPNPVFASVFAQTTCTDTMGPPRMLEKFWRMMIQSLSPQVFSEVTGLAAAATTNPYSVEAALRAAGITQDTFLGRTFGARRWHIVPQLDDHPYCQANATGDMWINMSYPKGTAEEATWAKGAANNADCVPQFFFYGPGDARAQHDRMARFEGDLDIGFQPGAPHRVAVFFEK